MVWLHMEARLSSENAFPATEIQGWWLTSPPPQTHIAPETGKCKSLKINFVMGFSRWEVNLLRCTRFTVDSIMEHTQRSFQYVECFPLKDGKIEAIECCFGGKCTCLSAVHKGMNRWISRAFRVARRHQDPRSTVASSPTYGCKAGGSRSADSK